MDKTITGSMQKEVASIFLLLESALLIIEITFLNLFCIKAQGKLVIYLDK